MRFEMALAVVMIAVTGCRTGASADARTSDAASLSNSVVCAGSIAWNEAREHDGEVILVHGPVVGARADRTQNDQTTYLDVGSRSATPERLTIVIADADRAKFAAPPETIYSGQNICVRGLVHAAQDATELDLTDSANIFLLNEP